MKKSFSTGFNSKADSRRWALAFRSEPPFAQLSVSGGLSRHSHLLPDRTASRKSQHPSVAEAESSDKILKTLA